MNGFGKAAIVAVLLFVLGASILPSSAAFAATSFGSFSATSSSFSSFNNFGFGGLGIGGFGFPGAFGGFRGLGGFGGFANALAPNWGSWYGSGFGFAPFWGRGIC